MKSSQLLMEGIVEEHITDVKDVVAGVRARKIGGSYQADGTIVSVFKTKAGKDRVVFEFDEPAGMLHIFSTDQIETKPKET